MRRFGLFLFPAAVALVASLLVARVTAFPGGENLAARTDRLGLFAVEFVTGSDALDEWRQRRMDRTGPSANRSRDGPDFDRASEP